MFFPEEDRKNGKPARALETARQSGRREDEGWRIRKDGTRFWALAVIDAIHDDDGKVIGFAKITRDITERRKVQEALLESERRFRLLIDAVADYAIFMLDPDGRMTNWNAGAQRITQYKAEDIVGEHFSKFYAEEDRSQGEPEASLPPAGAAGKYEDEAGRLRKDGTRFWAA